MADLSADSANAAITKYLQSGGNDGFYKFINGSDLRPYHIPDGVEYILQGTHTSRVMHYVDTLDMNIRTVASGSLIRAFSTPAWPRR